MAAFSMPFVDRKSLPKESGPLKYLEAAAPNFVSGKDSAVDKSDSAKQRYSQDVVLNALAQAGALRLNVRRVMISIVTRSVQYVIAESTRTMSLHSPDVHSPDDGLWMGCCALPTSAGLCQWTVSLADPDFSDTESVGSVQDASYFAVNDFTKDDRFKDAPFVTGAPYMRLYAGVPFFSKSTGRPIGSYCVLDDKPADNLSAEAVEFLKDMANAVSEHLELAKIKLERHRSEKMVYGIGNFFQGKSNLREWWPLKSNQMSGEEHDASHELDGRTSPNENVPERSVIARPMVSKSEVSSPELQSPQGDTDDSLLSPQLRSSIPANHNGKPDDSSSSTNSFSTEVKELFLRASNIIREATELQGVFFLDASSAGVRSSDDTLKKNDNNSPTSSEEELSTTENDDARDQCSCLGFSTSESSNARSSQATQSYPSIHESYLRTLLQRYPTGKVFQFDELSSSDSETASAPSAEEPKSGNFGKGDETQRRQRLRRSMSKRNDVANLANIFPYARSLAFVPLWDAQKGRWFAGAIAYSNQPTRSLTVECELSYLAAFGNSIMAEVWRIGALRADRAKSDFISSISHELRSPLHGILGNAELLHTTPVDTLQADLVHSIETCGRTLLDTVDHLLDFAKINNFLRSAGKGGTDRRTSQAMFTRVKSDPKAGMMMLESDLDIAILAEEVLQTAFSGHDFLSNSPVINSDYITSQVQAHNATQVDRPSRSSVSLILDIQPAHSYVFHAQGGALRRILMNACGNALKYTDSGFVLVKLQRKTLSSTHGAERSEVVITVTDSGRGMSKDYLRDRLYTPFAQEDPQSPGTGLGLSIMKQIVKSLHGTIDVQSEQRRGTTVRMCLTLQHSDINKDMVLPRNIQSLHDHEEVLRVAKETSDWTVVVHGFLAPSDLENPHLAPKLSPKDAKASELTEYSLKHLCQSWFRMKVREIEELGKTSPDIFIANQAGARELRSGNLLSGHESPLIVLCPDSESTATSIKNLGSLDRDRDIHYVTQPLGPVKLAKVLATVLARKGSRTDAEPHKVFTEKPKGSAPEIASLIPIHDSKSQESDTMPKAQDDVTKPSPSIKLLLVDDNNINLELLVRFCKKQKVPYETATNGLEALEAYKAANGTVQCVLMDISMPVMDGMESTREIRRFERESGVGPATVVALTGLASESAQQEAFASGIDLFLTKPVRLQELKVLLQTQREEKGL